MILVKFVDCSHSTSGGRFWVSTGDMDCAAYTDMLDDIFYIDEGVLDPCRPDKLIALYKEYNGKYLKFGDEVFSWRILPLKPVIVREDIFEI